MCEVNRTGLQSSGMWCCWLWVCYLHFGSSYFKFLRLSWRWNQQAPPKRQKSNQSTLRHIQEHINHAVKTKYNILQN